MSDYKMFKAITPLEYLGPLVTINTGTTITVTQPNPSDTSYHVWSGNAGSKTISKYGANRLVLMDDIKIIESSKLSTSGGSGATGVLNYSIALTNSSDQIINRYCRFQFSYTYLGAGLSKFFLTISVLTSWMTNSKTIQINYLNGITSGIKTTPSINIDWSDPASVSYYG